MEFDDLIFAKRETPGCMHPFLNVADYPDSKGYIGGRLCSNLTGAVCCLPCPLTDWVYPDTFKTLGTAAEWVSVAGTVCCVFLLLSWIFLPVEKTARHYLSICLTTAVGIMNLGFVIPLVGRPEMCADDITPNGMKSNSVCGASGALIILGGWCGIMWVFLRSLSLHLQICWQVVVGRSFMWLAQGAGWGIPIVGTIMGLVFSGVSFRFGETCHINHKNSLADLWIPLLVFAGLTIVVQLTTFAYCIKVYLASLADNSSTTEGSGLPSYTSSVRTLSPRQAYRRVRRVIQLQWRGIAIVLIIVADVIFFSVVFVFQDNTVARLATDPSSATDWLVCLATSNGDRDKCLPNASSFVVNQATIGAVLILLAMNGLWLLFLLGRWSMVTGWKDLLTPTSKRSNLREFVSADARLDDLKKDTRSYEMLSRGVSSAGQSLNKDSGVVTTFSPTTGASSGGVAFTTISAPKPAAGRQSPTPLKTLKTLSHTSSGGQGSHDISHDMNNGPVDGYGNYGRRTPDYFGETARYNAPSRSFSSPRPPPSAGSWDARETYASPARGVSHTRVSSRGSRGPGSPPPAQRHAAMTSHFEDDEDSDETSGQSDYSRYIQQSEFRQQNPYMPHR